MLLARLASWGESREGRPFARSLLVASAALLAYAAIQARHIWVPFAPAIRGLLPTISSAALVAAGVAANFRMLTRISNEWIAPRMRTRLYPAAFAMILLLAVVCRIVWTRGILYPGATPDGYTYLLPALENPRLPLSEARPIAFPYLVSISLSLFRHPIGILVIHNVLSIVSAAALAWAVSASFRMPVASLVLLAYMLFCAKNVAFEYLLLTEHLSRCVIALCIAILLWARNSERGWSAVVALALLTIVAILTKPNAVVLIPTVLTGFAARRWISGAREWMRIVRRSVVYIGIVAALLAGYMTLCFRRFGAFEITSMTGFGLYWNVNLLTDLNGPAHPEVKRELRQFFPRYVSKYGSRGENLGDWVLWGSKNAEIERDFGLRSPAAVVRAYVQHHGSGSILHRMDRVYMDLALEGIRAHPLRYLRMSLSSTWNLIADGLTFFYGVMPLNEAIDVAARAEFYRLWSVVAGTPSEHLRVPPGFHPVSRFSVWVIGPDVFTRCFAAWFPVVSVAGLLLLALASRAARAARSELLALLPAVCAVLSFVVLCGFVVPGEPPRYIAPIQDLVVMIALAVFGIAWRCAGVVTAGAGGAGRSDRA